jgi:lipopolysaccharide export LptBFGC system permease protein LptF
MIGAVAGPGASVAARASADDDVRMPGILTRTMAGELLKTILLTTGVLVSVIAFGAAIKPLARNLLGGADILRYIALASVPMLQYALPFSAGFGATLVMHRMASDNEIIAMSAAGLSHGRILRPVMLLGAALLVVMLVLVNLVVPVFWTRMETMLARDVTRLLASSVERGEAFDLGDTRIYADDVQIFDDPEGTTAETRLVLVGVAAIQTAGEGLPDTEFTADHATLDVYRVDGRSILKLVLGDATVFRAEDETLVRMPAAEPRAIDLGHRFQPNPKMFTLDRMLALRANPLEFWRVRTHVDRLADQARSEALRDAVDASLTETGRLRLRDARRDETWTITATTPPDPTRPSLLVRPRIERRGGDGTAVVADVGSVRWSVVRRDGVGVVDLDIAREVDSDRGEAAAERLPRSVRSLSAIGVDEPARPDDAELLDWAREASVDSERSSGLRESASRELASVVRESEHLSWDIDARIHQRFAQAVTAPLLLLLGSILAIHLRHSTPLAVYLVAFLPAIADILLISGGEQTLRRGPSFLGYGLLWSGNLLLIVFCVAAWLRLRRH